MVQVTQTVAQLLEAALPHVAFDGWSADSFRAAIEDSGLSEDEAAAVCPRGALDLAVAFHKTGDLAMIAALEAADLEALRYRDRVALAVRLRLESIADKEAVRRATTLFALPHHGPEGAALIWSTCDQIWTALGDTSDDVNWYTKRATLVGVYGATVLYWLGDDSAQHQATWAFLDRRIDNVMQIERAKSKIRDNAVLSRVLAGPLWAMSHIKAPGRGHDLPGQWR